MRRFVLFVGVLLVGASAAALAPEIEPDQLLAHIKFLSSDEMKGARQRLTRARACG
jgi:hypothetical protein